MVQLPDGEVEGEDRPEDVAGRSGDVHGPRCAVGAEDEACYVAAAQLDGVCASAGADLYVAVTEGQADRLAVSGQESDTSASSPADRLRRWPRMAFISPATLLTRTI